MTATVPHTRRALTEFWRKHQVKLAALPRELYDALDALIRADERRCVAEAGGIAHLAERYDDVIGENARLTRMMAGRHALGTCPHCERPERPRPVPTVPLVLVLLIFASAILQALALALNTGAVLWD